MDGHFVSATMCSTALSKIGHGFSDNRQQIFSIYTCEPKLIQIYPKYPTEIQDLIFFKIYFYTKIRISSVLLQTK